MNQYHEPTKTNNNNNNAHNPLLSANILEMLNVINGIDNDNSNALLIAHILANIDVTIFMYIM